VFKISTGETDEHRAVARAGPIIAGLKERIRVARATLRKPIETEAAELATAFRARQSVDPASAQAFVLTDVIAFVLQQQGHAWADYGRQVRDAGYDVYGGLRQLPNGEAAAAAVDAITGRATSFLRYFNDWKPHAGLKPRSFDQAVSTLKDFSRAVKQPIEQLEAKHIQAWIDALINQALRRGTDVPKGTRDIARYTFSPFPQQSHRHLQDSTTLQSVSWRIRLADRVD
jgi:hypothetical protein